MDATKEESPTLDIIIFRVQQLVAHPDSPRSLRFPGTSSFRGMPTNPRRFKRLGLFFFSFFFRVATRRKSWTDIVKWQGVVKMSFSAGSLTCIAPEKSMVPQKFHLPSIFFHGLCVNFRGCRWVNLGKTWSLLKYSIYMGIYYGSCLNIVTVKIEGY